MYFDLVLAVDRLAVLEMELAGGRWDSAIAAEEEQLTQAIFATMN